MTYKGYCKNAEQNNNEFKAYGLNAKEVDERIRSGLVNKQQNYEKYAYLKIAARNIFTYFNLIFIVFAVVLISQRAYNHLAFMGVVISNSVIGIVQEMRSKKELDKLNIVSMSKYNVFRGGVKVKINSNCLVKDDVAEFEAGNQIPADAQVLGGKVYVNESYITGEADEVEKNAGDTLYSGSFVVSGKCTARLTAVGDKSFASNLALEAKRTKKRQRPGMMKSLNILITVIGILIIPFAVIMFLNQHGTLGLSVKESVENTVASSIGMIPEGLYLLTSTALFAATVRLAKGKTLVHDMKCIESLARVDIICVDKTGTITEPDMNVDKFIPLCDGKNINQILCNFINAFDTSNATIKALKKYFKSNSITGQKINIIQKTEFSSALKYSAVMTDCGTYLLGAPEILLNGNFNNYKDIILPFIKNGKRVLLFADVCGENAKIPIKQNDTANINIKPLMFVVLSNPVRENAKQTFKYFENAGVQVKVISGDNPQTVSYAACEAGIKNAQNYIDVSNLSDDELKTDKVLNNTVFGRVSPSQKKIIICALKARKHTVAMTGDGVNDVLALKESDCSIAMASGAEAACNVADLVLVNSDFANMPLIVDEGRRVINNIERTAALFLVKNIFSFIMTLVSVFAVCYYPLKPVQISLVSAMMIGIPSFFLALEPNKNLVEGKFLRNVIKKALPSALSAVLSVCCLLIVSDCFNMEYDMLSTIACIVYAFCAYMMLFGVCKPFNIPHTVLFVLMGAGYVLCAVEFSQFFCMYALNRGAVIICILLAVFAYFVKNTAELLKQTKFFNFIVSKTHILRNMRV